VSSQMLRLCLSSRGHLLIKKANSILMKNMTKLTRSDSETWRYKSYNSTFKITALLIPSDTDRGKLSMISSIST
jgi:hypothetical protein